VSTTFYEGRLKTKGKLNLAEKSSSYQVIDTQQLSPFIVKKSGDGFKPMNSVHIDLTIKILRKLIRDGFQAHSIGIIVPFRSVLWDYRKTLQQKGFHDVEIGTVHTFQGREKSVILFDTVMSGEGEATGKKRHYTVRPFDELKSGIQVPRLLNVAFSRSKELFLVLADMKHIETAYRNRFLYKLLDTMLGTQYDNKQLLELAKDFTTTLR
jgi:superfamily I DNA and/or RNA helicase